MLLGLIHGWTPAQLRDCTITDLATLWQVTAHRKATQ